MDNIVSKIYESLSFSFTFKLLQQFFAFVFSILLARLLTPDEFGIVAIATVIIQYANNFTNWGFTNALVQVKRISEKLISSVFTLNFIISFLLLLILFSFSQPLANYFNNSALSKVFKFLSFYFIITAFYDIPKALLRRNINFRLISILEFLQAIFSYSLAVTLAYLGHSYWAIVYSNLITMAFFSLILIITARWKPCLYYSHRAMKEVYSFGFLDFLWSSTC